MGSLLKEVQFSGNSGAYQRGIEDDAGDHRDLLIRGRRVNEEGMRIRRDVIVHPLHPVWRYPAAALARHKN